jgi:hypothetical protein
MSRIMNTSFPFVMLDNLQNYHMLDFRKKASLQYPQLFYTKIALLCEE